MNISRRSYLWIIALFSIGAVFIVISLEKQSAQFSFDQQKQTPITHAVETSIVSRLPRLDGPLIAIGSGSTAPNGITLSAVVTLTRKTSGTIFAIRSLAGIYPDGTSERFEVLFSASDTPYREIVGASGISTPIRIEGRAPKAIPLPSRFPDSREALMQLTSNPYFKDAHTMGLALYFDTQRERWNYVVRTELGDVSILLPLAK